MIRFDDDATLTAPPVVTEALADKAGRIGAKAARVTKKTVTKNTRVTKKRGRPAKADARSPADRARAYRQHRKAKPPA
jgi:hypothetical protein